MRLLSVVLFASACSSATADPAPKPDKPAVKVPAKLSVTKLDPKVGDADGGTYLRVIGTNFLADGPRNLKVYFGSHAGTVVRVASDTEIIVEAPGGKPGETVDVLCMFDPGGERTLPKAFTFVDKASTK